MGIDTSCNCCITWRNFTADNNSCGTQSESLYARGLELNGV